MKQNEKYEKILNSLLERVKAKNLTEQQARRLSRCIFFYKVSRITILEAAFILTEVAKEVGLTPMLIGSILNGEQK